MFAIQYQVFTNLENPNSKYGIRKPWDENCSAENHQKIVENNPPKKSGDPPPNFQIHVADTIFSANTLKLIGGSLAGYSPPTQVHRACRLVKLHANNITYT